MKIANIMLVHKVLGKGVVRGEHRRLTVLQNRDGAVTISIERFTEPKHHTQTLKGIWQPIAIADR